MKLVKNKRKRRNDLKREENLEKSPEQRIK